MLRSVVHFSPSPQRGSPEVWLGRTLWITWVVGRGFLAKFAETIVGDGRGPFEPKGRAIVAQVEHYLLQLPRPARNQIMLAALLLPIHVSRWTPAGRVARAIARAWSVVLSLLLRPAFRFSSARRRARWIDGLVARLSAQSALVLDQQFKSIVVFKAIKKLLAAAYLDDEAVWEAMPYRPVTPRSWNPPTGADLDKPPLTPGAKLLRESVKTLAELAADPPGKTTYCVVGSGAGGAMCASEILRRDPDARVILLESGRLVANDQFERQVLPAVAQLYINGGFTLSKNQLLGFRQARVVGGSTLVNNAVALTPRGFWWQDNIVKRWTAAGVELDWGALHRCYETVAVQINAHPVLPRVLSKMSVVLREGFEEVVREPESLAPADVNLEDCIGCGRCNYGCEYGAKMSMQESIIPGFVERGGLLVANAHVDEIHYETRGSSRVVTKLEVTDERGTTHMVEADKFILAAGSFASTNLLFDSKFTGAVAGCDTVGAKFSGNFGTPVFGRFPEPPIDGWDGLQEGTVIDMPATNLVIETWFQPPGIYGLVTPKWGASFLGEVEGYGKIGMSLPVFGSSGYGRIVAGPKVDSHVIDMSLEREDWRRLAAGMKLTARAMFNRGALEVYDSRFDGRSISSPEEIDAYFDTIDEKLFMDVETAHLQGGNVIHPDPRQGVVDCELRVHGFDNLWITDASVIPAPVTLNVQTTIMALAHYAAPLIVAAP